MQQYLVFAKSDLKRLCIEQGRHQPSKWKFCFVIAVTITDAYKSNVSSCTKLYKIDRVKEFCEKNTRSHLSLGHMKQVEKMK